MHFARTKILLTPQPKSLFLHPNPLLPAGKSETKFDTKKFFLFITKKCGLGTNLGKAPIKTFRVSEKVLVMVKGGKVLVE